MISSCISREIRFDVVLCVSGQSLLLQDGVAKVTIGWYSPAQTPVPVTMHSVLPIVIHGKQCNAVSDLLQQLC